MITVSEGKTFEDGTVEPRHTVQVNCPECGFDITEDEVAAGACSDCGATFDVPAQSVSIVAASAPLFSGVM